MFTESGFFLNAFDISNGKAFTQYSETSLPPCPSKIPKTPYAEFPANLSL